MDSKELAIARQSAIDHEEQQQYTNEVMQRRAATSVPVETIGVNASGLLNMHNERLIRRAINPFIFYKHVPVALLTDQAESYDDLTIRWSFSNGQFNARPGIISSKDLIKNIIGLRISGGRFPWHPMTILPYQRQIFILVEEFADIAMRNRAVAYHFIMTPDADGQSPYASIDVQYDNFVPSFNGYFWFPAPVQDLNTLSLKFATSNGYFDARHVATGHRIHPQSPEYKLNPMQLPYPTDGTPMVDGETYYFENAVAFPNTPPLELVTRQQGWPITDVGGGFFSIPVDGSTVLSFDSVNTWITPVAPIDFSLRIDLIYLGDQ